MTTIAALRRHSDNPPSAGCGPAATTLAQIRRLIFKPSPQLQLPKIISTTKLSCCSRPGALVPQAKLMAST